MSLGEKQVLICNRLYLSHGIGPDRIRTSKILWNASKRLMQPTCSIAMLLGMADTLELSLTMPDSPMLDWDITILLRR